ncbi:MAG: porphobilinogen synthase [Halobacteriovoraceae bacterium]|nr:porphobilinogen synthase [Halobacteriovoraceae bacterium]
MNINQRPRRNRKSEAMRSMVRENHLEARHLIAPLFVIEGENKREEISSMPGQYRLSIDLLLKECEELVKLGVPCVSLFPALSDDLKDKYATESANPEGLFPRAIRAVKERFPELLVMSDVAMDPYSSDGHDGLVSDSGEILNDETLPILAKMAVTQAQAGSDIIGPSDMMDSRVSYIIEALDKHGLTQTSIMSYTAKYASCFYGPFRDALDSAPKSGDKKTYQMDPANVEEAMREARLDTEEGADILMVKPGLPYLDVVRALKQSSELPIAVYNISGEYAMIKAASEKGWLDGEAAMMEVLLSFRRAGADMILTYFAKEAAQVLSRS